MRTCATVRLLTIYGHFAAWNHVYVSLPLLLLVLMVNSIKNSVEAFRSVLKSSRLQKTMLKDFDCVKQNVTLL